MFKVMNLQLCVYEPDPHKLVDSGYGNTVLSLSYPQLRCIWEHDVSVL